MRRSVLHFVIVLVLCVLAASLACAAMSAPTHEFYLSSPTEAKNMKYVSSELGVDFSFATTKSSYELTLVNNSESSIRFLWDQGTYVDLDGQASALVVSTEKAEKAKQVFGAINFEKGLETSSIAPSKTQFFRAIVPKDHIKFKALNAIIPFASGFTAEPLVPENPEAWEGKSVRLLLLTEKNGQQKQIEFQFTLVKVGQAPA